MNDSQRTRTGETPRALLVGRGTELENLERELEEVRQSGSCRAVSIVGAGGVGKSRLVRDFLQALRGQRDKSPRVFRTFAREVDSEYGVFSRLLRARFSIVEGMDVEAAKAQLRAQVATTLEDRKIGDVAYFLGQILGLEFHDSPLTKAVEAGGPIETRKIRNVIIRGFLEADAGVGVTVPASSPPRGPMVLVLDDLHLAHDNSLELLSDLVTQLKAPILFLVCARPELLARRSFRALEAANHRRMDLAPLSDGEAELVMQELLGPCGDHPSVPELVEAGCALAGGNPGYLEQMLRIFMELGVIEVKEAPTDFEDDEWHVHAEKLADVRLPMTVEEAVAARIATLSPRERDLLERAAVMGGVFWLGGILSTLRADAAIPEYWDADEDDVYRWVRAALDDLTQRDYILHLPDSTFHGDDEYAFKHNLERETLIRYLSPEIKRRYHAKIADWLSHKEHVRSNDEYLGMLGSNRELAGEKSLAAYAYLEAANVARERYSYAASIGHFDQAFRLVKDGAEMDPDRMLKSLHHYGDVLQSVGRNQDAIEVFRRMLELAYRTEQRGKGGSAHGRIGRLYRDTGRLDEAKRHLKAALKLYTSIDDIRGIASTTDDLGKLYWLRGRYDRAREFTTHALEMRRKLGDKRSIALSLNNLGLVYQDSGQYKLAKESFEQALVLRKEANDLVGVIVSLNNLGTVMQDQRDDEGALKLFSEAFHHASHLGDRARMVLVQINLGETLARLGRQAEALETLRQAEASTLELGDRFGYGETMRAIGKAYQGQGDLARAREYVEKAIAVFREIGSLVQIGISLRTLGEVFAMFPDPAVAEKARGLMDESQAIFTEIGNEIELARTYRSLGEVLRSISRMRGSAALLQEAARVAELADVTFAKLRGQT